MTDEQKKFIASEILIHLEEGPMKIRNLIGAGPGKENAAAVLCVMLETGTIRLCKHDINMVESYNDIRTRN